MPGLDKREIAEMDDGRAVLVYSTAPSRNVAEEIGRALVEEGLAACVNIVPGMVSIYRWEGTLHTDDEVVLLAKTRLANAARVIAAIRERHPYEIPAIVVLPVAGGSRAFLDWIDAETAPRGDAG